MTNEHPTINFTPVRELSRLVRENLFALTGWGCTIAASIVAFRLTEGTPYHPLATGFLMSSSSLFTLMSLFELFWRLFVNLNRWD